MYIIFIHILQFVCFLICLFCVSTQRITYFMSRRDLRLLIVTTLHYLILHFLKLIWSKCYKQWRKNEKYLPLSFDCIDINRIVITLFKKTKILYSHKFQATCIFITLTNGPNTVKLHCKMHLIMRFAKS